MMKNVMGIINLNENDELLQEITRNRPLAAVPFGGRYRLIDFILSNMVNAGIRNIGILTQAKYRSLMAHLRSGKEWDLARKRDGLFFLPPTDSLNKDSRRGDVQNFFTNLDYINSGRQKYVLLANSNTVCNINFREAFRFHEAMQADITILYRELGELEAGLRCSVLEIGANNQIEEMKICAERIRNQKVSMDMYIMKKQLLVELVEKCFAYGGYDLVADGLIKNKGALKIYGYKHDGYAACINSIQSYFRHSMDLLNPDIWRDLFFKSGLIYTKVKDEAPAKYKESANVQNSLVADGCQIEGSVENSILFRDVKVKKGAYMKNCIIMQQSEIEENVVLENVVCDKNACITEGKRLKGEANYPVVVTKGAVV